MPVRSREAWGKHLNSQLPIAKEEFSLVDARLSLQIMSKLLCRPTFILVSIIITLIFFIVFSASSSSRNGLSHPSRPVILKPAKTGAKSVHREGLGYTNVQDIANADDYDPLQGAIPVSSQKLSQGGPIMPHLGNETVKAELGRASWKLFHTILARYPEKPSSEEREALSSYIYLFSRVYPCGECATHFQKLLKKYPPQTSSRIAASQWGCHIHNQVNTRLGKLLFDCNEIAERYQCGCDDTDSVNENYDLYYENGQHDATISTPITEDHLSGIQLESKEGLTKGG
ncbi:ERV/ALR sulfhydryl oxidase domain-containing protein [Lipomyces japonicus]|uniref:ERV/ALR sulfhydryl oxidase domain-containing protein n=1 Tax=Lipomyces japonicus TaxID=56871 RepID=UPI0034CF1507